VTGLAGRSVAIVGASSGIGLAVAQLAAARGARVAMLSRSRARLDAAAATIPGARAIAMDMLDRAAVDRAIGELARDSGQIDHLVLTAVADELASKATIAAITPEQVERALDKLRGFVHVMRAAAPALPPTGSVVLVTGASAQRPPRDGFSVLAAVSGSLLSFGKALALELAPVRVNVVMSGVVDTAIHAATREQTKAWAERELPARRFGQPEDIAQAIELLLTNPYITASTLTIDGGLVA